MNERSSKFEALFFFEVSLKWSEKIAFEQISGSKQFFTFLKLTAVFKVSSLDFHYNVRENFFNCANFYFDTIYCHKVFIESLLFALFYIIPVVLSPSTINDSVSC